MSQNKIEFLLLYNQWGENSVTMITLFKITKNKNYCIFHKQGDCDDAREIITIRTFLDFKNSLIHLKGGFERDVPVTLFLPKYNDVAVFVYI